jgi:hypothetical protein
MMEITSTSLPFNNPVSRIRNLLWWWWECVVQPVIPEVVVQCVDDARLGEVRGNGKFDALILVVNLDRRSRGLEVLWFKEGG